MILRSPADLAQNAGTRNAAQCAKKFEQWSRLWNLALEAMQQVDPEFATKYTALAVTMGFEGSPHIDKQNVGPFYGMSLGTFEEGEGGICVECSARQIAHVNTRNRLGKVTLAPLLCVRLHVRYAGGWSLSTLGCTI